MTKKPKYFDPDSGRWLDQRPWPAGRMPDGAAVSLDGFMMDQTQAMTDARVRQSAIDNQFVLDTARRNHDKVAAWKDHFDRQRAQRAEVVAGNQSYARMCDDLSSAWKGAT